MDNINFGNWRRDSIACEGYRFRLYKEIMKALEALMMLGFTKSIAEKSLNMVAKRHGENLSVEEMIRFALKTK